MAQAACGGDDRDRTSSSSSGPIVVAVVRADGVLVPFAAFESGKWISTPGASVADRPSPWFADRVDALDAWIVRLPVALTGLLGEASSLHVTGGPVAVESHCQRVWGLSSDLERTPSPEHALHHHVAVAFAGDVRPTVVAELERPVGASPALGYLTTQFDAAEGREATRRTGRASDEPRAVGASVAKRQLELTRLYRVGRVARTDLYSFEAVRTYRPQGRDYCDDMSVMTGWLAEGPRGVFSLLDHGIAMTDCDRKGSPVVRPMAALSLGQNLVVFTVEQHYEGETYSIVVVGRGTVARALSVWGGGC